MTHVWFASEQEIRDLQKDSANTDIYLIHGAQYRKQPFSLMFFPQASLIKYLRGSEEDVWASLGKHSRKFIQRSIREATEVTLLAPEKITDETLEICASLYERMKAAKGIPDNFNTDLAKTYTANRNLMVALAYVNGTPVGFKASIYDQSHLRSWVSAFSFREDEFDRHVISRAHQQVEWQIMRWCLVNGIEYYDFGGISSFEKPNGIDEFKIAMAKDGERVEYDNFLVGKSLVGKLAILGYALKQKLRK